MAFQRGKDSKSSLGLGGYTFDTLKPGAILKSLKWFGLSNTGHVRGYHGAANRYAARTYFLVVDIEDINNYYKSLRLKGYTHMGSYYKDDLAKEKEQQAYQKALTASEDIIHGKNQFRVGSIKGIDKIGKQKFNNMFEIVYTPH